uniref:Wall-associated receptor kinase galacturonan-binding domain-containing protein n=1 Tax=Nelumbo nucifera TaxID=4432 RepID=A0A822YEP5_NELNU|nr:TPA_asm: hypothetical protein HUJ06_030964 [Nelumbo nucifera]
MALPLLLLLHRLPLLLLCLCEATTPAVSSLTKSVQEKPGCPDKCGNITVPYPFGFGNQNCYREGFRLSCDQTSTPPKLSMFGTVDPETGQIYNFGYNTYLEVTDISLEGQLHVRSFMQYLCYQNSSVSRDCLKLARNSPASVYRPLLRRNSSTVCYKPGLASALRGQARINQDWTNTPYTYSVKAELFWFIFS